MKSTRECCAKRQGGGRSRAWSGINSEVSRDVGNEIERPDGIADPNVERKFLWYVNSR